MVVKIEEATAQFEAAFPGTVKELVKKTGWARTTVERRLHEYREATPRKSHIIAWRRPTGTGPFIPVHGLGAGEDKHCNLKPLTKPERWQNYVKSKGREYVRKKDRTNEWLRKARSGKKPLLESLFFSKKLSE